MSSLFCGDSLFECGVWLNRLFPLRILVSPNNLYSHFAGQTGPTRAQKLEQKRLKIMIEYLEAKHDRTKKLLDLQHDQLESEAKIEEELHG